MLFGKQCRRHEDSHLFTVKYSPESSFYRNLCLAVADIAAQQHIHGCFRMHVFLYLLKGLYLVRSLVIKEKVIEFPVHSGILTEDKSAGDTSFGIQLDELVSHFPDFFSDPLFCLLPFFASEPVNRRRGPLTGAVFLQFIYAVKRDIKFVALGILQGYQVLFATVSPLPLKSCESSYSVILMHHEITGFQIINSKKKPGSL